MTFITITYNTMMIDRDPSVRAWRLISDLVKSLSTLLLRCLPDFWRLSKAFIEGKFAHKVRKMMVNIGFDTNKR